MIIALKTRTTFLGSAGFRRMKNTCFIEHLLFETRRCFLF